MNKKLILSLFKTLLFGFIWAILGLIIALLLIKANYYNFKDVLFIEGILLISISILSSLGGNSTGLSLHGVGIDNNPSMTSYVNLEITKNERKKNSIKQTIVFGFSSLSFVFGGILLIILNLVV